MRKRSSWASGSGNVPSCSIVFSVAITKNGCGQRPRVAVDRDLVLGHRLEQRRLRLRQRPVDLVHDQDVREDRAGPELEPARLRVPDGEPGDVRRLQVGRALDPRRDAAVDARGERAREHRLRRARHVLEQDVTARRERGQREADHVGLPHDHLLDVAEQPVGDLPGRPEGALVLLAQDAQRLTVSCWRLMLRLVDIYLSFCDIDVAERGRGGPAVSAQHGEEQLARSSRILGPDVPVRDREMIAGTHDALGLLASKWKIDVLYLLATGARRYSRLHGQLPVSKKVLTETLRAMERDGLVKPTHLRRGAGARRVLPHAARLVAHRGADDALRMGERPFRRRDRARQAHDGARADGRDRVAPVRRARPRDRSPARSDDPEHAVGAASSPSALCSMHRIPPRLSKNSSDPVTLRAHDVLR